MTPNNMRTIKFRAKRESGEWIYGSLNQGESGDYYIRGCYDRLAYWIPNPESIGQFTGLTDVTGVEIYEGDIVEDAETGKAIVVFQNGCFFMMYDAHTNMDFLGLKVDKYGRLQEKRIVKVIGNTTDNPEML